MMGYVQTTQNIIDWYMHGPNASMTLVQNFRAAMTVPTQSQQQQSPQNNNNSPQQMNNLSLNNNTPLNANETNSGSSDTAEFHDTYSDPLGVTTTADSTYTGTGATPVAGIVVAVASVAAAGVAAYSLIKQEGEE